MGKKVILQRKRLAAIFASFSVLIIGTASLFESMTIDYYSVINTIEKIIPACISLGGIGWLMGMILDKPKRRTRVSSEYKNLFLNKSIKNEVESKIYQDENLSLDKEITS